MRVQRFEVTPFAFERVFVSGNSLTIVDGIPDGGKVVRAGYDHLTDVIYLIVEHESFDDVPEGNLIPAASFALSTREQPVAV